MLAIDNSPVDLATSLFSSVASLNILDSDEIEKPKREPRSHADLQRDTSYCMHVGQNYQSATGRAWSRAHPCGNWRNRICVHCFDQRLKKFKVRIRQAIQEDENVKLLHTDDHTATQIVRKYGKSNCLRFPRRDSIHSIFISTPDDIGEPVSLSSLEDLDWIVLADTPNGSNVSGNLKGKTPSKKSDETVNVSTTCFFVSGLEPEKIADAEQEAYEATPLPTPTTREELQASLRIREIAYVKAVERRGGKIAHRREVRSNVILSGLQWNSDDAKSHAEVRQGIVRPYLRV